MLRVIVAGLGVAIGAIGLVQTPVVQRPLQAGDKVRLYAANPASFIPGAPTDRDYLGLLSVATSTDPKSSPVLPDEVVLMTPGRLVEVVRLKDGPKDSKKNPAFVGRLLEGKLTGTELIIPTRYARPTGAPAPPGERPWPSFYYARDNSHEASVGDRLQMVAEDGSSLPVALNYFAFEKMWKYGAAADKAGLKQLVERGDTSVTPSGTTILVHKVHHNQFITDGAGAIEGRLLDGPLKGKEVWTFEAYTGKLVGVRKWDKGKAPAPKKKTRRR